MANPAEEIPEIPLEQRTRDLLETANRLRHVTASILGTVSLIEADVALEPNILSEEARTNLTGAGVAFTEAIELANLSAEALARTTGAKFEIENDTTITETPVAKTAKSSLGAKPARPQPEANYKSNARDKRSKEREEAIVNLNRLYKDHPGITDYIKQYHSRQPGGAYNATGYFTITKNFKLLDKTEEQALFKDIESGLAEYTPQTEPGNITSQQEESLIKLVGAYQVLFASNIRLAAKRAWALTGYGLELEDLIQEANIGLLRAIIRFDHTIGNKFSTYATHLIDSELKRALANKSRLVRLPDRVHLDYIKTGYAITELSAELGREPTREELSKATGIPLDTLEAFERFGNPNLPSLDQPIDEDNYGEITILDALHEQEIPPTEFDNTHIQHLTRTIETLEEKYKLVISLRFGIYIKDLQDSRTAIHSYADLFKDAAGKPVSYRTISQFLGVTVGEAKEIVQEALDSLRLSLQETL